MKSPIKSSSGQTKSVSIIKEMIPQGSVIHSYGLFDAYLELTLAEDQRFVIGHTPRAAIYDFWQCMKVDPERLYLMTKEQSTHVSNERILQTLQKSWYTYADPYLRSALFFLLNRCTQDGKISAGHIDVNGFNPLSLSRLRGFKSPNFHLSPTRTKESHLVSLPSETNDTDYLLYPIGKFRTGIMQGSAQGFEDFFVDHRKLSEHLITEKRKAVVLLEYHPAAIKIYNKFKIVMIDSHGQVTLNKESCKELIIANF